MILLESTNFRSSAMDFHPHGLHALGAGSCIPWILSSIPQPLWQNSVELPMRIIYTSKLILWLMLAILAISNGSGTSPSLCTSCKTSFLKLVVSCLEIWTTQSWLLLLGMITTQGSYYKLLWHPCASRVYPPWEIGTHPTKELYSLASFWTLSYDI